MAREIDLSRSFPSLSSAIQALSAKISDLTMASIFASMSEVAEVSKLHEGVECSVGIVTV